MSKIEETTSPQENLKNDSPQLSNPNPQPSENTEKIENLPLNSTWTFWYASRKEKDHHIPYSERLTKLAEFDNMQDFFKYYVYLKPVNEIERNVDIGLFKQGYQPLWESCPNSGCWLLRFKRTADLKEINLKWEKVVFSLISEQFDEPNILGAVLSIRGRETIIEIWFNYFKYDKIKNMVAVKFGKLLLGEQTENEYTATLYFKDNGQSMVDKSTLKNTETYSFKKKRKYTYQ